jgi:hypothetical protein
MPHLAQPPRVVGRRVGTVPRWRRAQACGVESVGGDPRRVLLRAQRAVASRRRPRAHLQARTDASMRARARAPRPDSVVAAARALRLRAESPSALAASAAAATRTPAFVIRRVFAHARAVSCSLLGGALPPTSGSVTLRIPYTARTVRSQHNLPYPDRASATLAQGSLLPTAPPAPSHPSANHARPVAAAVAAGRRTGTARTHARTHIAPRLRGGDGAYACGTGG